MLAQIQKVTSSWAKLSDGTTVVLRLHSEGNALEIITADKDNKTMHGTFNETSVQAIKDSIPSVSIEEFFTQIQNAMNYNNCKITPQNKLEVKLLAGNLASFPLAVNPSLNGQQLQLEGLLHCVRLRLRPREFDRQLEELTGRENEVRLTALELEKEQKNLLEGIQRAKEQDELNNKRIQQLEAEIAQITKERIASGADVLEEDDDELAACRVRVPLTGTTTGYKDIDMDLFTLLKSKSMIRDLQQPVDPRWCSIIRPWTTSELEQQTARVEALRPMIWKCLANIEKWDFDVFALQTAMTGDDYASLHTQPNGGSLFVTAYALLMRYGVFQRLNLDERLVLQFLSVVEAGYNPNPYHNSMHSADVLHITHYILSTGGMLKACKLADEDILATIFSATIHDYAHPGINNSFHCKAHTYLACLYNDRSILENIHVSSVFELMKLPRFNCLSTLTDDQRRDVRETMVEMVLATDMGLHAKILGQFRRRLQDNHELTKKDDIRLALSVAIKLADISNCGRPERLYMKWCSKIADEFYMQGDRERNEGLIVSPFMDRFQPSMAKGQIAFMNYIVVPLFESVSELLPDMHFTVDHAEGNKQYWVLNDDTDRNTVPS